MVRTTRFVLAGSITVLLLAPWAEAATAEKPAQRPNVLFIAGRRLAAATGLLRGSGGEVAQHRPAGGSRDGFQPGVLPAGALLAVEDFAALRAASVDDEDLPHRSAAAEHDAGHRHTAPAFQEQRLVHAESRQGLPHRHRRSGLLERAVVGFQNASLRAGKYGESPNGHGEAPRPGDQRSGPGTAEALLRRPGIRVA